MGDQQGLHGRALCLRCLVVANQPPGTAAGDLEEQQLPQNGGGHHQPGHCPDKDQQESVIAVAALVGMFAVGGGEVTGGIQADQQAKKHHRKDNQRADAVDDKTEQRHVAVLQQRDGRIRLAMGQE
ncbi:hypothetical protein D3C75_1050840 [compost metagenome]